MRPAHELPPRSVRHRAAGNRGTFGKRQHQIALALVLAAITAGVMPASAQGRLLEKCSRGQLDVCFAVLARPRLDPGRRAAIELHLAEIDKLAIACSSADQTACATLADRYPDLPPDLARQAKQPAR